MKHLLFFYFYKMTEIIPHKLYLSGLKHATNLDWLRQMAITDIITLVILEDMHELTQMLKNVGIRHHVYGVQDNVSQKIDELFPSLIYIIDSAPTVLVHCQMGISRSATVVLAYLINNHHSLYDATMLILNKREILPNDGFIRQLIKFEHKKLGTSRFLPNNIGVEQYKQLIANH